MRRPPWITLGTLAIIAITALVYAPVLQHEFLDLDDPLLITQNPYVHSLTPASIAHDFTTYDPELYIPLTLLTYQLEYSLVGASPWLYHLDNLLLHLISITLLIAFVWLLTKRPIIALVAGVLFALHPINVEAVAWAAARKDVLSSALALGSLTAYLWSRENDHRKVYWLSLFLFALALLAKVSVIMLPLGLLLIHWLRKDTLKQMFAQPLPFLGLSVFFGIVALGGKTASLDATSPKILALLSLRSVTLTLQHLLIPTKLSVFYPFLLPVSLPNPFILLSGIVCLLLIGIVVITAKRARMICFGMLWFLLFLLPSFLSASRGGVLYSSSDRYAYLAGIGIFLILAYGFDALLSAVPKLRKAGIAVACLFGLGLSWLSAKQVQVWQNDQTLFAHAAALNPEFGIPIIELGKVARSQGDLPKAIELIKNGIALGPDSAQDHYSLGATEAEMNRPDDARREYDTALHMNPNLSDPHFGKGILLAAAKNWPGAIAEYQAALWIRPDYVEVMANLGAAEGEAGKQAEEESSYRRALRIDPTYIPALFNLSLVEFHRAENAQGRELLERILQIDPTQPDALRLLRALPNQ